MLVLAPSSPPAGSLILVDAVLFLWARRARLSSDECPFLFPYGRPSAGGPTGATGQDTPLPTFDLEADPAPGPEAATPQSGTVVRRTSAASVQPGTKESTKTL